MNNYRTDTVYLFTLKDMFFQWIRISKQATKAYVNTSPVQVIVTKVLYKNIIQDDKRKYFQASGHDSKVWWVVED